MPRIFHLSKFDEQFLDKSFYWLNDPIIQKSIDGVALDKEDQLKWFNTLENRTDYKIWGLTCDNAPIGVVGLRHITSDDAEFFCYVGEKDYWGGCGRPIMELAEQEAKQMNLKSLWLRVLFDNPRAKAVYDHMNYSQYNKDDKFYFMRKYL